MGIEENKALVHRFFTRAWEGDLTAVDELIAPDSIDHSTVGGKAKVATGANSFKQIISMFRTAMPDLKLTILDEIAEGDKVVHRWQIVGTNTAPLMGIPPTGKQITFTGTTVVRVARGKIAERWANLDE
ncbi:MAG: ester cyclase, partial [Nitrososphaerota archaeon]|nr:ester cyclase [Nitrososphaerota archaeon]